MGAVTSYEIGHANGFSIEFIQAVEAELMALARENGLLKADIEVIREKRRDVIRRMAPWEAERARLYAFRGIVPGDVVVSADEEAAE